MGEEKFEVLGGRFGKLRADLRGGGLVARLRTSVLASIMEMFLIAAVSLIRFWVASSGQDWSVGAWGPLQCRHSGVSPNRGHPEGLSWARRLH